MKQKKTKGRAKTGKTKNESIKGSLTGRARRNQKFAGGLSSKKKKIEKQEASREKPRHQSLRMVVGHHACKEVLKVFPRAIHKVLIQKDWKSRTELRELIEVVQQRNYEIQEVSESRLAKICQSHQGICIEVTTRPKLDLADLENVERAIVVALDGIVDPHNLGAMMRTLWLMGGQGILLPQDRSVGLNATVAKVASGGAEHIPVEIQSSLPESLDAFKKMGFWIYGLSVNARVGLWDLNLPQKVLWVVGSESQGIRKSVEKKCDELVAIPQVCADASYNASISLGLALSETVRQNR